MKRFSIFISVLFMLFSCQSKPQQEQKSTNNGGGGPAVKQEESLIINWVFDSKNSADFDPTMPVTEIFVKINQKKISVIQGAQGDFYTLDKSEYGSWQIPESALSVCLGGWGGLVRCVYAEKQKNELYIKQAWNDAESDVAGWMDIETVKTINLLELTP